MVTISNNVKLQSSKTTLDLDSIVQNCQSCSSLINLKIWQLLNPLYDFLAHLCTGQKVKMRLERKKNGVFWFPLHSCSHSLHKPQN